MSTADDALRTRLEALLAEARESGREELLRPTLTAYLHGAPLAPSEGDADVPTRFGLVGDSDAMRNVHDMIDRVRSSDAAVLIVGETGTGKELVARALHVYGPRASGPFVAENCAAVPGPLLESELFGHTKGAFTGAVADRVGRFVAADGGTLFLDEIGDMPLELQAKLLRALEHRTVRPVGGNENRAFDVRLVAATHRDLDAMGVEGTFREDLRWRLDVVRIELPPLRERPEDVAALVRFLLGRIAAESGRTAPRLTAGALARLAAWRWPGNVRELENELRRAVALGGAILDASDLSPTIASGV